VDDHNAPLLILDLHADAAVMAAGLSGEPLQFLGRKELGVRIVQLLNKSACRFLIQCARVDTVHETIGHERQHLIEDPCAVARSMLLNYEAANCDRKQQGGNRGCCAKARHDDAREKEADDWVTTAQ